MQIFILECPKNKQKMCNQVDDDAHDHGKKKAKDNHVNENKKIDEETGLLLFPDDSNEEKYHISQDCSTTESQIDLDLDSN